MAPELSTMPIILGPLLADPPIFTIAEFQTLTMAAVMDAVELLDLREELRRRAEARAKRAEGQTRR